MAGTHGAGDLGRGTGFYKDAGRKDTTDEHSNQH